jgi:hypothetical protein
LYSTTFVLTAASADAAQQTRAAATMINLNMVSSFSKLFFAVFLYTPLHLPGQLR